MTSQRPTPHFPQVEPTECGFCVRVGFQPITCGAIHAIQDADTALLGLPGASPAMDLHRAALRPLCAITEGM